jgi:hypothetical protein
MAHFTADVGAFGSTNDFTHIAPLAGAKHETDAGSFTGAFAGTHASTNPETVASTDFASIANADNDADVDTNAQAFHYAKVDANCVAEQSTYVSAYFKAVGCTDPSSECNPNVAAVAAAVCEAVPRS